MIKRFCDCCGKELGDTWYVMYPMARDNKKNGCTTESTTNSLVNVFARKDEYCAECISAAMEVLEKKY